MEKIIRNPHPGIILKEEFLDELGLSVSKLSQAIGVDRSRIHHIVKGRRSITADTDLRLSKFFGLSEGFWLRLQIQYDLREAKRELVSIAFIKPYKYQETRI
jgi:addiction module HigA family antidote